MDLFCLDWKKVGWFLWSLICWSRWVYVGLVLKIKWIYATCILWRSTIQPHPREVMLIEVHCLGLCKYRSTKSWFVIQFFCKLWQQTPTPYQTLMCQINDIQRFVMQCQRSFLLLVASSWSSSTLTSHLIKVNLCPKPYEHPVFKDLMLKSFIIHGKRDRLSPCVQGQTTVISTSLQGTTRAFFNLMFNPNYSNLFQSLKCHEMPWWYFFFQVDLLHAFKENGFQHQWLSSVQLHNGRCTHHSRIRSGHDCSQCGASHHGDQKILEGSFQRFDR